MTVGQQTVDRQNHDLESFMWHYSRSQLKILGFIQLLLPATNEAEDVLQETSIVLLQKWPEFDQQRDFTNWACGIARFEAFKYLRTQKKHFCLSLELLKELSELALERSGKLDDQQRQDALSKCFEKLTTSSQNLLRDRYNFNKSVAELARILDKTERAVYKNLSAIRKTLQECIARRLSEVMS